MNTITTHITGIELYPIIEFAFGEKPPEEMVEKELQRRNKNKGVGFMKYKILDTVDADKFHCWDITTEIESKVGRYLGCEYGELTSYSSYDLRHFSTHITLQFHDKEIDFTVSPFEVIDIEEIAKNLTEK